MVLENLMNELKGEFRIGFEVDEVFVLPKEKMESIEEMIFLKLSGNEVESFCYPKGDKKLVFVLAKNSGPDDSGIELDEDDSCEFECDDCDDYLPDTNGCRKDRL